MTERWFKDYFDLYRYGLFETDICEELMELKKDLEDTHRRGKKTMIMGNGGSAAIASHVATDLSKNAKIRAVCFNDASLITCLSNDYGYSEWMAKAIRLYGDEGDLAIFISSSGKSSNITKAAKAARSKDIKVVTFTGFDADNPLRQEGDLNFWLDSHAYNVVENIHQVWLLAVCDAIIGKAEYPAC